MSLACGRKEKYLENHLRKSHGYIKGTKRYWTAFKESRPVSRFEIKKLNKAANLQLLNKKKPVKPSTFTMQCSQEDGYEAICLKGVEEEEDGLRESDEDYDSLPLKMINQ